MSISALYRRHSTDSQPNSQPLKFGPMELVKTVINIWSGSQKQQTNQADTKPAQPFVRDPHWPLYTSGY